MKLVAIFLLFELVWSINGQCHHLKFLSNPEENHSCTIIENTFLPRYRGFSASNNENEFKFTIKSAVKAPADANGISSIIESENTPKIIEVFAKNRISANAYLNSTCKSLKIVPPEPRIAHQIPPLSPKAPEIRKIIDGGDQLNRIDVVFMGDGYTSSERSQFFQDMERLTREMFEGVTFRSYLPLFNIWAIYVESRESGIGYDGPKDTPFQLFREKGELRVIWPGNPDYAREICALTGPSGCDYPSLIANDDYYGGLGGEFVISTKSNRTGTFVLRHEMGHNFIDVGDEYDSSPAYSGVNSAETVASLGWSAWLTSEAREERAIYRILEYPWADLNEKGPQTFNFTSDGEYHRWYLLVSVSAAGENDSLEFLLDGEILPWESRGFEDREFYSWEGSGGFSEGNHSFQVRSKTEPTHPSIPRMICSVTLHEFGDEDEFKMDNKHVSAYPTWDLNLEKKFRPTNAGCLMRNITHETFCPVCQEGMWAQFLERVSLIDNVIIDNEENFPFNGKRNVSVNTLKLGQLREQPNYFKIEGERLEVRWSLNSVDQPQLHNLFIIEAVPGIWEVEVEFITPEVRSDPRGLLKSSERFVVT